MADLYLKSMDIPATGNTYKIVQPDGYYPDMTAGQITTNIHDTNSVPYVFRPTPFNSTRESGDIVGASVAWNQLVRNGNFANGSWWSGNLSVADNVGTVTASSSANYYLYTATAARFSDRRNRVLFLAFDWKTNNTKNFYVALSSSVNNNRAVAHNAGTYTADTWYTEATIVKYTGDYEVNQFRAGQTSGITAGDSFSLKNVVLIDLTLALGSSIADYIYTLESGTEGAGIAKLREWGFFTKPYYAYNAGSIESVNVSKHIMRDGDDNIIGEYPLDYSLTLRGILKLDGNNNLYADGDVYEADGTVTRKYAQVTINGASVYDFGTSSAGIKYVTGSTLSAGGKDSTNKVATQGYIPSTNGLVDKSVRTNGKHIYVFDNTFTDLASAQAALNANPITLVYELATPTTETADPYNEVQVCSPYGTEEFVDAGVAAGTRDVAIPVGHNTEYMKNIVGAIEGIPLPPSANGTYTLKVTVTSGVPSYSWVSG